MKIIIIVFNNIHTGCEYTLCMRGVLYIEKELQLFLL